MRGRSSAGKDVSTCFTVAPVYSLALIFFAGCGAVHDEAPASGRSTASRPPEVAAVTTRAIAETATAAFEAPSPAADIGGAQTGPAALVPIEAGAVYLRAAEDAAGHRELHAYRLNENGVVNGDPVVVFATGASFWDFKATRVGNRVAVATCTFDDSSGGRFAHYWLGWFDPEAQGEAQVQGREIARERPLGAEATTPPCTVSIAPTDDGVLLARGTSRLGRRTNAFTVEVYPEDGSDPRILVTARQNIMMSAYIVVEGAGDAAIVASLNEGPLEMHVSRFPLAGPPSRCRSFPCRRENLATVPMVVGVPIWTGDEVVYAGARSRTTSLEGLRWEADGTPSGEPEPSPLTADLRCNESGDRPLVSIHFGDHDIDIDPASQDGPSNFGFVFWALGLEDHPASVAWTGSAFVLVARDGTLTTIRCIDGELSRQRPE